MVVHAQTIHVCTAPMSAQRTCRLAPFYCSNFSLESMRFKLKNLSNISDFQGKQFLTFDRSQFKSLLIRFTVNIPPVSFGERVGRRKNLYISKSTGMGTLRKTRLFKIRGHFPNRVEGEELTREKK